MTLCRAGRFFRSFRRVAQIAHTVVRGLHFPSLPGNQLRNIRGEIPLDRLAIFRQGGIFPALAFGEDRVLIAADQRRLQVDPAAMQFTEEARVSLGLLIGALHDGLQLSDIATALLRVFREERLQLRVLHIFRGDAEAFLPVATGLNGILEDGCCG